MAYNNNAQQPPQPHHQRPQLPSIHNLNAPYYSNYPPMPPGPGGGGSSSNSGGGGMHDGASARPYSASAAPSSAEAAYSRHHQAAMAGSSTSETQPYSPLTQTPPETGQPSPAATTASGGGGGGAAAGGASAGQNAKGNAGGSEFVKKLFNMLDDGMHNHIVSWGAKGDSFIVKDMNEFTKSILPKHFKHSNFASFVRQLNKYDFHKVKNPESQSDGHNEQLWEFKHPNFRADMKASLEQIKRKGPAPRKAGASAGRQDQTGASHEGCERMLNMFQQQMDVFAQDQHNLRAHLANLTRDYHGLIGEVQNFRSIWASHDHFIQNIISVVARQDSRSNGHGGGNDDDPSHSLSTEVQNLVSAYNESNRATYDRLETISQSRPSLVSGRLLSSHRVAREGSRPKEESTASPTYFEMDQRQQQQQQQQHHQQQQQQSMHPDSHPSRQQQHQQQPPPHQQQHQPQQHQQQHQHQPYPPQQPPQHQQPDTSQSYPQQNMMVPPPPNSAGGPSLRSQNPPQSTQGPPSAGGGPGKSSAANQPQWTVRPKVLLVEDDPISRKLSSKFLEVLGCSIEAAEDGVTAVNKMNSEKFDLVFMDINMPNLDGVSATSLIRQFDPMTPIISMTSNSNPSQILTYFSHGMNDILPKPFTKEGLLLMLEKHLEHLKQMQQLTEIPRALGIPDHAIESALVSTFNDPSASNPFADLITDLGVSEDPGYMNMFATLVNQGNTNGGQQQQQQQQQQQPPGGGYRKREADETELDHVGAGGEHDGSGGSASNKRGRYSDVL